jgi:pSer/pThr/pTyr-binding forkhead associated (FHA) protein
MEAVLVMIRSGGEHRPFKLSKDTIVIGRREDCDLRIPLGDISRKHCRLTRTDLGYSVSDMGSSNGTFVNGRRVQSLDLEAGDTLQIGPVVFVLQVDNDPAYEDMHPILAQKAKRDDAASDDIAMEVLGESPTAEADDIVDMPTQIRKKA